LGNLFLIFFADKMNITDEQWEVISEILPRPKSGTGKKGRPARDQREVLNGILWICRTGAQWNEMPSKYPPYQTCHRYFQGWTKANVWEKVLRQLAWDLKDRGKVDITECFIDGTFASAKKGGLVLGKLRKAKAQRSWQSQTLLVFLSPYGPQEQAPTK
jgi:transposase